MRFLLVAMAFSIVLVSHLQAAMVCSVEGVAPQTDSDYINRCFLLSARIEMNLESHTFVHSEQYSKLSCGGWAPFYPLISGSITKVGAGRYHLTGSDVSHQYEVQADVFFDAGAIDYVSGSHRITMSCL